MEHRLVEKGAGGCGGKGVVVAANACITGEGIGNRAASVDLALWREIEDWISRWNIEKLYFFLA